MKAPLLARLGFALCVAACGADMVRSGRPGAAWAADEDRSDSSGRHFMCEGQGPDKQQALAAAQSVCTDKVCRVCGVEIESVVQTTETLQGISMQRKVVERCRRLRKHPLDIERENLDCGQSHCVARLEVRFSKDDEKSECSSYAAEDFDQPERCERLIDAFRNTDGRSAHSFRRRTELMDQALSACRRIDVRPTPLLESLGEKLQAGMDRFEFTAANQQARLEEPFFAEFHRNSRAGVMESRDIYDFFLTTSDALRQKFRESRTLVARLQLVRDYVHNRALVFDLIEAAHAEDLDTARGVARFLSASKAAPVGRFYADDDVHLWVMAEAVELRSDLNSIIDFYRRAYPPKSWFVLDSARLADMQTKDGKVDAADWSYMLEVRRANDCVRCLSVLLDVHAHGSPSLRTERFFAALRLGLDEARTPQDRLDAVRQLLPPDNEFTLQMRALLEPDLQPAFDWSFLNERVEMARRADDQPMLERLVPMLVASLVPLHRGGGDRCVGLHLKLQRLSQLHASLEPLIPVICACGEDERGERLLGEFGHAASLQCARGPKTSP